MTVSAVTKLPEWDRKMPKTILSSLDADPLPYAISSALHYSTGIPGHGCGAHGRLCAMCGNAVRLVLQAAEPKIIETVVKKMARAVGHGYIDLHPRGSDD